MKFRQNRRFRHIHHICQLFDALLAGLVYLRSTFHQHGEISPESWLSPNSQNSPNLPTFRGPSSWVNLFTLDIPSTTLPKYCQNCHFRQIRQIRRICQLFGALLAGLIYLRLTFHPQLWQNFARIAAFHQIRRICQLFRALLAGLIYLRVNLFTVLFLDLKEGMFFIGGVGRGILEFFL